MRRGEILTLRWDQIRKEQGLTSKYIFTYNSKTIRRVEKAFKRAFRRAGIQDFKFRDLRHTFASHAFVGRGVLKDVQELLGHKTMTMPLRYSHLSQEHKRKAVNLLNGLTSSVKSDMSQNGTILSPPK